MTTSIEQFYHKLITKEVEKVHWLNLYDAAPAFITASIATISPKPLLIITPDALDSYHLEQEFRFFLGKRFNQTRILSFPGWETLPYDYFSPPEDVVSQRGLVLYKLATCRSVIVFISASTLMHRLPPKDYIESNSFVLEVGEELDFDFLRNKLEGYSYNCVSKVMEHGEFTVRGSIIDIFPMGSIEPYRIDLLNTMVDSIRVFDVDTQLSFKTVNSIRILPAREFPFNDEAIERFCDNWRSYFGGNPLKCSVYQDVSAKQHHPGVEYYFPFFFENTTTFFDYLSSDFTIVTVGNVGKNMQDFWHEINVRYEQLRHDQTHPILAPQDLFVDPGQVAALKNNFSQIVINNDSKEKVKKDHVTPGFKTKNITDILSGDDTKSRILGLQSKLEKTSNVRVIFIAGSVGRREILLKMLHDVEIFPNIVDSWQEFLQSTDNKVAITIAPVERSMHALFAEDGVEILAITETQIFGEQITRSRSETIPPKKLDSIVRNLTELKIGDPVVHIDYGVGRYLGLQKIPINNYENEFLILGYAEAAKVYVPVASLELINRYTGTDAQHVPLHHLGSKQWEKIKIHAEKQIRDTAVELLEIYAKRLKSKGFSFTKPEVDYERFATAFPFVTTVDQGRAIDDVISDMISGRMMDRLICGDVGFGKTEVAMRAAFLAAYNGKQVAILTPTTLLAEQHFTNFKDRFADWPFRITLFSRMRDAKDSKNIVEDLFGGKIDIVIGTHKLLQKNIRFKDLGLLIIDEEHRFGVKQKEHIKSLASHVDILALTATPIPRTLNMAFVGIRDFSIISTPPAKRLSIKTFICEYELYLIKEAILRETLRGGQVYFLHNNIATIEETAKELHSLIPGARIAVAHGQMRKQELEQVMRNFYHLHINLLVCTTIIESGLDVPTANTIIINRADKFGLAQLHQLRGRVGRSHHQAYAYLIVPPKPILSQEAKKRLEAIEAMKDLGTGFALAINDLEIRGAGEILGEKQSGVMQGIGFTLYMEMLERAVKSLKKQDKVDFKDSPKSKPEIELHVAALIQDNYVDDVNLRLVLYKKIADAKDQAELEALQVEMIDRFGLLPETTKNLFKLAELRLKAQARGIAEITLIRNKGTIKFSSDCDIDPNKVLQIMQKNTSSYKFVNSNTIKFSTNIKTTKLDFVARILEEVGQAHFKKM